jgi:hypothetical protein
MLRFLLFLLLPGLLYAHQIIEMPMTLDVSGDKATATIEADAAYMVAEFRGDENQDPKDLVWLRDLGPEGWQKIEEEADTYWHDCLRLVADGTDVQWKLDIPEFHQASPRFMNEGEPEELPLVDVIIRADLPAGTKKLQVAWKEPFGKGEEADAKPIVSGDVITVAERNADELTSTPQSIPDWIVLGYHHILPQGVDHILFVLGLFLLVPKWKPLLQQTITFTIAHSISLGLAAMGWVHFPPTPVEVLIAASIAWVGFENLWAKELGKGRVFVVGAFGLIHGLGFASALAEYLPPDQPEKIPGALLGFNVGVEMGQIVVLIGAFALFGWWGKKFVWVKRIGSVIVGGVGLLLVIERISGIDIVPFV